MIVFLYGRSFYNDYMRLHMIKLYSMQIATCQFGLVKMSWCYKSFMVVETRRKDLKKVTMINLTL